MKKTQKRKIILSIIFVLVLGISCVYGCFRTEINVGKNVFASNMAYNYQTTSRVNVGTKTTYKIMQINDLHNSVLFTLWNNKTFDKLDKVVRLEQPDLVVMNGDIVWSLFNECILRQLCNFFEEREIYFCYAFGNHDSQFGSSATRLARVLSDYDYSLFKVGFTNLGLIGNYFVTLEKDNDIKLSLAIMNSGDSAMSQAQVDYYTWAINGINSKQGEVVNNLYFQHVPLKQVELATNENMQVGKVVEKVSTMKEQHNLFEKIKELGSTKWIFSAHDHPNDFYLEYEGIYFRSCRGTGYSAYTKGREDRGVTIIEADLINSQISDRTIKFGSL